MAQTTEQSGGTKPTSTPKQTSWKDRPPIEIQTSVDQISNAALRERASRYRTPFYYNRTGKPGPRPAGGLSMGPEQVYIKPDVLQRPSSKEYMARHGIQVYMDPNNPVEQATLLRQGRGYWENPQRIVRYRNFLRSAPPGYQPPPWLPVQEIETAYEYMKFRNQGASWQDWLQLPDQDPGTQYLRTLPAPPAQFLMPNEYEYAMQQAGQRPITEPPFADWDKLQPWQQAAMSILSPQPGMQDRPEWSRLTAAGFQGALAGLGGAAVGTMINPGVGSLIGFLAVGIPAAYQAYTGNRVPIIAEGLELFDIPAIAAERAIGVGQQAWQEDWNTVMRNFPAAWEAGQFAYDVAEEDVLNTIGPALSGGIDLLHSIGLSNRPGGWIQAAGPGEVWKFSQGYTAPVKTADPRGAAAQKEFRERIAAGEDPLQIYAEVTEKYGDTGTFNDFVLQSLIDPTNLAPFAGSLLGEGSARIINQPRLAQAFRNARGNPIIDLLPWPLQPIVSGVTKIQGSEGVLTAWKTYQNWIQRGYFPKGIDPTPAARLGQFEKWAGGLTESGQISSLLPRKRTPGIRGFIEYTTSLTDESKAHLALGATHDHINVLFSLAGGDPVKMGKLLRQAAGTSPVATGDTGQAILNSPVTATIAGALADALADGVDQTMLQNWVASAGSRKILNTIATALGLTPGQVLEQFGDNPQAFALRVNKVAPAAGTPDMIAKALKPFTGDSPDPWNPEMYQAQLALAVFDRMDKQIATRYGLKPDHAIFRLSQVLKSMQSLLLLGINPAYLINNSVNNLVTRAAVGAFGMMTPGQIDGFMTRFGIVPDRLRVGVDPSTDRPQTNQAINAAMHKGDWIDAAQRLADSANKLGIFSRWSARNERSESGAAYAIGMTRFWRKNWKRGNGFRKMPAGVEAMLDRQSPGAKAIIYQAIEAGMNMDEIYDALMGEFVAPSVVSVLEETARQLYPENPEIGRQIIEEPGVIGELQKELRNAQTPEQINQAFDNVESRARDFVDEAATRGLIDRAEDVRNQVENESAAGETPGFAPALGIFTDLQVKTAARWLRHFAEWQELYNQQGTMSGDEFDVSVRRQMENDEREWKRINEFELQSYAGIIQALGIETEPARTFSTLLASAHENWRKFYNGWEETRPDGTTLQHDGRNQKLKKFFATYGKKKPGQDTADWRRESNLAWQKLQEELADDYRRATEAENSIQGQLNQTFAQVFADSTGRPAEDALGWRTAVQEIRMQMQVEMAAFRKAIVNMTPDERRQAWTTFVQHYNALIVELKSLEVSGAHDLANQPAAAAAAVAEIEQAVPAQPAAQPEGDEATINAAMADAERGAPSPRLQENLATALRYGIVDRAGKPLEAYARNIVNDYLRSEEGRQAEGQAQPEEANPFEVQVPLMITNAMRKKLTELGQTPEQIRELTPQQAWDIIKAGEPAAEPEARQIQRLEEADPDLVDRAMAYHERKHGRGTEANDQAVRDHLDVTDILAMADRGRREAAIHAAGMLARRHVRTKLQEAFRAKPEEIDAAMLLMDTHADRWARLNNYVAGEAARDAWYATHVAGILSGDPGQVYYQAKMSQDWYYSQLEKTLEGMPNKMTPEALTGFMKGKVKAEELKWTGFEVWIEEQQAAGKQVTREEALAFIRANRIRVKEVLLGADPGIADIFPDWNQKVSRLAAEGFELTTNPDEPEMVGFIVRPGDDPENYDILSPDELPDHLYEIAHDLDQKNLAYQRGAAFALTPEYIAHLDRLRQAGWDVWTKMDEPNQADPLHFYQPDEDGEEGIRGDVHTGDEIDWLLSVGMMNQQAYHAARQIVRMSQEQPSGSSTRYQQYRRYGGKDYRELLLQWENTPKTEQWIIVDENGNQIGNTAYGTAAEAQDLIDRNRTVYPDRELSVKSAPLEDPTYPYVAPHWNDPNVLAHVRFSEQTTRGERVLYIEEIQSDWHEQGRKKGYVGQDPELVRRLGEATRQMIEKSKEAGEAKYAWMMLRFQGRQWGEAKRIADQLTAEYETLNNEVKRLESELEAGVQPAPFAGNWEELAVKRMIRWAAENGYDRVAWTSGELQYSLWGSELFGWKKNDDGSFTLIGQEQFQGNAGGIDIEQEAENRGYNTHAQRKVENADEVRDIVRSVVERKRREYSERNFDEYVSRLAARLWERMQAEPEGRMLPRQEGMTAAYDRTIPNLVQKYIKKWGGKVEPTKIGQGNMPKWDVQPAPDDGDGEGFIVFSPFNHDEVGIYDTREEAEDWVRRMEIREDPNLYAIFTPDNRDRMTDIQEWNLSEEEARQEAENYNDATIVNQAEMAAGTPLQGFAVTPAMKEAALAGQPLFQRQGAAIQPMDAQRLPAFRSWFGKSVVNDGEGRPMVVYHGTGADFEEFRHSTRGEIGIHFGTREQAEQRVMVLEEARQFAGREGPTNLLPVYLRLENPIILDYDPGQWYDENWARIMKRIGRYDLAGKIDDIRYRARSAYTAERDRRGKAITAEEMVQLERDRDAVIQRAVVNVLQEAGYDGVIYENQVEGEGQSYLVLDPNQVKSIHNAGAFGPTGNIFYQRGQRADTYVGRIRDAGWVDPATVAGVFSGGTPRHLKDIASFITEQRQKYNEGRMTVRDIAKAYLLTVSSIGSASKAVDSVLQRMTEGGIQFTRDGQPFDLGYYSYRHPSAGTWHIRPEEVTAAWLMSDQGRRALDLLEEGQIAPEWDQFIRARNSVYGRFGGGPDSATGAWFTRPGHSNLTRIQEFTDQINAAQGDLDAIHQAIMGMEGISDGKVGFVKHLLGFGDEATIDTQEILFWTDHMNDREMAELIIGAWKNTGATSIIKGKIQSAFSQLRADGIGADIPEETFAHIMHHWLWDAQKKTETTHQGMYRAMRFAQDAYGAVEFLEDGRAVIHAINSPTIATIMHEVGHIFRRDLPEADLNAIAQWGGLKGTEELRRLEQSWAADGWLWREYDTLRQLVKTLQASEVETARFNELANFPVIRDLIRYEAMEEKFARGWEKYLADGSAPTPELRSVFRRFTDWMLSIYQSLKRKMGRVVGFEQTIELAGLNLSEEIAGTRIRDVFDRLLVDEARRPVTLDALIAAKLQKLQGSRRYATYTKYELEVAARRAALQDALRGSQNAEAARAKAEQVAESGQLPYSTEGSEIDPTAIYDAAQMAETDTEVSPWSPLLAPQPAATNELSRRERAILDRGVSTLPPQVRDAIQNTARVMLADIQSGGSVLIGEGDEGSLTREGNSTWYWQWYDEAGKPAGFKASLRAALEKIIVGTEDADRPIVRRAKAVIMDWVTGDVPTDQGYAPDAAVLWYLGRKDKLFEAYEARFDQGDDAWLLQQFGAEADRAVADYIVWLENRPAAGEPTEQMRSNLTQRIEQADSAGGRFEDGQAISIADAMGMQLAAGAPLPRPADATAAAGKITAGLRGRQHEYAQALIAWIENGERDSRPLTAIPIQQQARIDQRLTDEVLTPLRAHARARRTPTPTGQAPADGVMRMHAYRFGEHTIAAGIYQDGTLTALLPAGQMIHELETTGGPALYLGIDPQDPTLMVVRRGEKIQSIDPGRIDDPRPEPEPPAEGKQHAWQRTRAELEQELRPIADAKQIEAALANHKNAVEQALRDGKPVPKEVLDEYPGLQRLLDQEEPEIRTAVDEHEEPRPDPSKLYQRRQEHQWVTMAKFLLDTTASMHAPGKGGWVAPDGTMLTFDRRSESGEVVNHNDNADFITGGEADYWTFSRATGMVRFNTSNTGELDIEIQARLTPDQIETIAQQARSFDTIVIELTKEDAAGDPVQIYKTFAGNEYEPIHAYLKEEPARQLSRAGNRLYQRGTEHPLVTKAKATLPAIERFDENGGWITPDGVRLKVDRSQYYTHLDSIEAIVGDDLPDFYEFVTAARMIRVNLEGANRILVELFGRPTPDQVITILQEAKGREVLVEIVGTDSDGFEQTIASEIFLEGRTASLADFLQEEPAKQLRRNLLYQRSELPPIKMGEYVKRLRERYQVINEAEPGSMFLTPDGEIIHLKGDDHEQAVITVTDDPNMEIPVFLRRSRTIRMGVYVMQLGVSIARRPTAAQVAAILKASKGRVVYIDVLNPQGGIADYFRPWKNAELEDYLTNLTDSSLLYQRTDEMNPDEMRQALLHDEMTGLRNRRAYEEDPRKPFQLVADVEGLKFINDTYGHDAGDQVIKAAAVALRQAAGEQNAYRGSDRGDEFIAQFDTQEEADAAKLALEQLIDQQVIEAGGQKYQGLGVSVGIGTDMHAADQALNKDKLQAQQEGRRANRGEKPVNLRPQGNVQPAAPAAAPAQPAGPRSTWTPMHNFMALADVPSPLSGYVGNKRSMLAGGHYDEILSEARASQFTRIVEGFGGSALLGNAFAKRLKMPRIYNELDPKVVSFHRAAKENPKALMDIILGEGETVMEIFHAYPDGGPEAYGAINNYWKEMQYRLAHGTPLEQAALLTINNSGGTSIMGGGSQKLISGASTTEGSYVWRISEQTFQKIADSIRWHAELMKGSEIREGDARQLLRETRDTDLVLLDPPYVQRGADDTRVTGYDAGQDLLTLEGAVRFIEDDITQASRRGVGIIYTNNAHPVIVEALRIAGFHIRLVEVRSMRSSRMEVVAWNDKVAPAEAGWRAARTGELQQKIGNSKAEYAVFRSQQGRPAGQAPTATAPLGGTPTLEPMGEALEEMVGDHLSPMLRQARSDYQTAARERSLRFKELDPDAQREVGSYLRRVESDMASTKYASMAYGEQMRDGALLNYSRRYGFDNFLGLVYPYQFWYTRSMFNWAARMIDRPSWFAMYARWREAQERMDRNMPSRLKGKMRMPAPWLPDWAGGGIWSDPLTKIFPFAQFGQPMDRYLQDKNMVERRAESILEEMVEAEQIGAADAAAALRDRSGQVWDQAVASAEMELDKSGNPASMVGQMMQPALWWNALDAAASGKPEKMSVLPVTRTAQSLRTATRGTMLEPAGGIAGLLAWPEEQLRENAGLSQFGQWGDYLVDRALASMAADGTVSATEARRAMIERNPEDPVFAEANSRVEYEQMLRTPGAATLQQAAEMDAAGAIQSLPTILFPGGLFPEGELKFRGLKTEYDKAWNDLRAGNEKALTDFYDRYPEYEARTALYAEPEERLRQFMVNEIWDRYFQLESPNRRKAIDLLGQDFEDAFLNKETRAYDAIPVDQMALWTRILGGIAPRTEETAPALDLPSVPQPDYWTPEMTQAIGQYQADKDQAWPEINMVQSMYFQLPKGSARKSFLAKNPKLKQYWDWKDKYEQAHPELAPYFEPSAPDAMPATPAELNMVSPPLARAIAAYLLGGYSLSSGAQAELDYLAASAGRSIEATEYARMIMAGMVQGDQNVLP